MAFEEHTEARVYWGARSLAQLRTMAIVDDPASPHGQRMARILRADTRAWWVPPTLDLPTRLLSVEAEVWALPLRVRGGHSGDAFTSALADAVKCVVRLGRVVFVARGLHPNPVAEAGIAVVGDSQPSGRTASEACVAAAQLFAFLPPPNRKPNG